MPSPNSMAAEAVAAADSVAPANPESAEHHQQRDRRRQRSDADQPQAAEHEEQQRQDQRERPDGVRDALARAPPIRSRARCGDRRRTPPASGGGAFFAGLERRRSWAAIPLADRVEPGEQRARELRVVRRPDGLRDHEPLPPVLRDVAAFGHADVQPGLRASELRPHHVEQAERILPHHLRRPQVRARRAAHAAPRPPRRMPSPPNRDITAGSESSRNSSSWRSASQPKSRVVSTRAAVDARDFGRVPQRVEPRVDVGLVVGNGMARRRAEHDVEIVETAEAGEERPERRDHAAFVRQQAEDVGVEGEPADADERGQRPARPSRPRPRHGAVSTTKVWVRPTSSLKVSYVTFPLSAMHVLLLRPVPGNERFGLGPFFRIEPLGHGVHRRGARGARPHGRDRRPALQRARSNGNSAARSPTSSASPACTRSKPMPCSRSRARFAGSRPARRSSLGGHTAAAYPDPFLSADVDAVVLDDGERVMPEIVDALARGRAAARRARRWR